MQNIVHWFLSEGDTVGSFIAYSTHFSMTGQGLRSAFESADHSWIVSASSRITLEELQNYDGVFIGTKPLGEDSGNTMALLTSVMGGGNVYIFGGTNFYGAIASDNQITNAILTQMSPVRSVC